MKNIILLLASLMLTFTVSAQVAAISGPSSFCEGTAATYSNTTPGGSWSSSNTSIAIIGTGSGIAVGVTSGVVTLTYTVASVGSATYQVTVNPHAGSILGSYNVCTGGGTILTNYTTGGTWSAGSSIISLTASGSTATVTGVSAGVTSVSYTNTFGCFATVPMTVNPTPSITGPSTMCGNATITLSSSIAGGFWTSSSAAVATVHSTAGIVTGISGGVTIITYSTPAGCFASHPVTVAATPLPISTTTGSLCAGSTITVSCSTTGGTWSSSNPSVGSIGPFGVVTGVSGGTCVISYSLASTGCSSTLQLNVFGASPSSYTVTGGGGYCSGGTGVAVGLNGSQSGIAYQLYRGSTAVGSLVWGTGSALSFGLQTVAGTYTVVANPGTSCSATMTGSVVVTINPLPISFAVTGGGTYTGGSGIAIGLSGSQIACNYQLMLGSTAVISPLAGTGTALSFGLHTTGGVYTVIGINTTTGCVNTMSGSATITTTLSVFSVTGGGSYCAGGSGVAIGLSGSVTGATYQLYNGSSPVGSAVPGTGSAISFGLQTAIGTYTVVSTVGSSTTTMTGSATIVVNPLPVAYGVVGGGAYCSTGLPISVANSASGVTYRLYRAGSTLVSTLSGTGSIINFPFQTITGTYSVTGTSAAGCVSNMANTVTITTGSLPSLFSVGGGGSICSGGSGLPVTLSGSQAGTPYQIFNGTTPGIIIYGTGSALSFGSFTTPGTYTVVASNGSSCLSTMSGSAVISVITTPVVYTVTGGGSYCSGGSGVPVGLSNSQVGVNYQLFNGTAAVGSSISGTGAALSFGAQTTAGIYTVVANPGTPCVDTMSGSATVTILPGPSTYAVSGGGVYCVGGTGVAVGIGNSQTGVSYQLYRGGVAIGSALPGTGGAISFGFMTTAGTYTVIANPGTTCATAMTGAATVTVNTSPTAFPALISISGGGGYCSGAAGVAVSMPASAVGVNYQLYRGIVPVGSPLAGVGSSLSFGLQPAGVYSVVATSTATGCSRAMPGSSTITMYPAPAVFTVIGGGSFCSGGSGVSVSLSGSATGVNYRLYRGTTPVGSSVPGTGGAVTFGTQTVAGTYTAIATTSSTSCTSNMSGSATVSVASVNVYTVTGGGGYCSGGSGLVVGVSNSDIGVNYQLRRGTTSVGSPVAGTGAAISFPPQTVTGTYTVVASSTIIGCSGAMSGSASIATATLPAAFSVTGGGSYCSGGSGVAVGLSGTTALVTYQLYSAGAAIGSPVSGTGAPISFGLQTSAGAYTVVATSTVSGCTRAMSGLVTVAANPLPSVHMVTGGGGYCSGGSGVAIGLGSSTSGISYRLYRGTSYITAVSGGGSALSFGLQTVSGTYTVVAYNTGTTCSSGMAGSAIVTVNPLPTITGSIYTVMPGASITLSGSPAGGIWSGSATTIATIGSTSGVVAGISLGTATISYTLPTGCRATRSIGVTPTGFRPSPGSQEAVLSVPAILSVMPNPSRGIFTLKYAFPASGNIPVNYTVTDMLGKVLFHAETVALDGILDEQVILGNVAGGHYLLSVNTATERKTISLLIE